MTTAITVGQYTATVQPSTDNWSGVLVSDAAAEAADAELAVLARREEALGGRRFSARGEYPGVDALYDDLNRKTGDVKADIARQVLRAAAGLFDAPPDVGAAYFSRYAGCDCPCSAGVVTPGGLRAGGRAVYVSVELAH